MKVSVTQENLSKALGIVSRTASSRTTLPILNNIFIKAEAGELTLSATNLETATTQKVPASTKTNGVTTVPARLITEFVSNLPKVNIDIDLTDGKMKITAGGYKSVINTTPADDFPALPELTSKTTLTIPSEDLKKAIASTSLVASSDTTRPILTGVYLHSLEGKLYMAATDGYRLAEKNIMSVDTDISAIVPASTLNDVSRVIGDEVKKVVIGVGEDQIEFIIGQTIINSRLIDGNFINYRQLIPTSTETEAVLDRAELLRITKISELFARESAGSITLNISSAKSTLSVHSIASELGENDAETEAETKGDGTITLNSKYLLDALNQIDDDVVKIQFNGKLAPILITADKNADYKHIIMPVKS